MSLTLLIVAMMGLEMNVYFVILYCLVCTLDAMLISIAYFAFDKDYFFDLIIL